VAKNGVKRFEKYYRTKNQARKYNVTVLNVRHGAAGTGCDEVIAKGMRKGNVE